MDWVERKNKVGTFLKKNRYVVIVLLIGVFLMLLPTNTQQSEETEQAATTQNTQPTLEERLSSILSQVSGAGEVNVILTLSSGEETLYQTDSDQYTQSDSTTSKSSTITITDSQRNETGLIRQINPPSYLGAIVICQGADNPSVRLAIVEAVSNATGLGADKISVLKMK